jgi:hypothetical protein
VGYQRKSLQILGGGLSMLPPGDKIPATDYLLAQNWRVDSAGKLQSRNGYTQKFSIAGAGLAHSAGVHGGILGDYYIGCNNGTISPAGSLYFNFGASAIATGFDGNRIALAPMNGWMFAMNRGKAVKHNPVAGVQNYGLTAPTGACTAAVGAGDPTGPSGSYQYYVTFMTTDSSVESNPSPVSNTVAPVLQDVSLTGIPVSADPQVGSRNIYATGGTLGQAYQVGTIADNTTTTLTISISDLDATDNGVAMPTTNDPPPLAAGMLGPYFSRLLAWSTVDHANRLFWTDPDLPQYWPGSADNAVGNWVDVGQDGEAIVWCTQHNNSFVIYKERSIWMLVGDPDSGYLQQVSDEGGICGQWAVTSAGAFDYFVGPGGLYTFDMSRPQQASGKILPIFNQSLTNNGAMTPPGSILLGTANNSTSVYPYAVALGYAMGKLYIGYAEQASAGVQYCLMVYNEVEQKWFYHRNAINTAGGWYGFLFDGAQIVGLTGIPGSAACGFNLDDFRNFFPADPGSSSGIECCYQSHFEDCGLPNTQKVWLEVAIDYECAFGEIRAALSVAFNGSGVNGESSSALTLYSDLVLGPARQTQNIPLTAIPFAVADGTGVAAKSISVALHFYGLFPVTIHNVFLYYYEEAPLVTSASTLPTDLGAGKVKQCKELELDIDTSNGIAFVNLFSDLPGNLLALRTPPSPIGIAQKGGRAVLRFPFATLEGYLWKLAVNSTLVTIGGAQFTPPFRLYSARLLMRVIGVYVEAYEAAAGFVWDSMELTFDSGITHIPKTYQLALAALPIKRAREISLEIETFGGNVTVTFLSDLPGDAQAVRFTKVINTAGAGRRFVRLPLPGGTLPPVEGRLFRLQLSGASKFILYEAAVELLAVGVYIEAYEAATGAVYDSREQDFTTPAVKEARELELDIETTGPVNVQLLSDLTATYNGNAITTGRQKVMLPLTINAPLDQFVEGRLLRLILSGVSAFRLYGARVLVRPFGQYLTGSETSTGALWDTTELDLGSQTVKQLRELELDLWAYGGYTVTIYTDLPGNVMQARVVSVQALTSGRTTVQIPLPQGLVPDNYIFGRLVRVTITSAFSVKLFGARIDARAIGVYVESYEAAGGAVWDSTPADLGSPSDKTWDQVRFEADTDGAASVTVYTDLPGETFTSKGTFALTNGVTSRHWATVPLPPGIEGRSIRLIVNSGAGFRIYKVQVRAAQVGRYLCALPPDGNQDALTTLEFDFRSERVKLYKKLEIDMRADGAVNLQVITNQTGALGVFFAPIIGTPNGRETLSVILPPGARGRLLRLAMSSASAARIYAVRVWTREVNDEKANWGWAEYPLEESDVLPKWSDLPVAETAPAFTWSELPVTATPPAWNWAPFPVAPTGEWFWGKVIPVTDTPDEWDWITVPFDVTG